MVDRPGFAMKLPRNAPYDRFSPSFSPTSLLRDGTEFSTEYLKCANDKAGMNPFLGEAMVQPCCENVVVHEPCSHISSPKNINAANYTATSSPSNNRADGCQAYLLVASTTTPCETLYRTISANQLLIACSPVLGSRSNQTVELVR